MKITAKGFLFWKPTYGGNGEFELLPWDCRDWEDSSRDGRVFVAEHTTDIEVPDDFNPLTDHIKDLEAAKQKARADFQARITELDRQIQSLMAIEHVEPTP